MERLQSVFGADRFADLLGGRRHVVDGQRNGLRVKSQRRSSGMRLHATRPRLGSNLRRYSKVIHLPRRQQTDAVDFADLQALDN